MKTVRPLAAAAALMMMLLAGSAQAAYTVYLYESGGDVRASGSGSLNLAGAVGPAAGVSSTVALIGPFFGLLHTGAAGNVNRYTNIVGPAAFGAGGPAPADASAGDLVGIRAVVGEFFVPAGYVSGAPLSSSAVWNGTTIVH